MDDDFVLNFATSNPATATKRVGSKEKGRWADRSRDKKRVDVAYKRENRPKVSQSVVSGNTGGSRGEGGDESNLGKRSREDASSGVAAASGGTIQPKGSLVVRARPSLSGAPRAGGEASTTMIQPRQSRPAYSSEGASSSNPPINKNVLGPGGKKQYISSLFTAEGLPIPSKASSAPVAPARPSNAPLRAVEPEEEEEYEQTTGEGDEPVASTSTAPEPIKLIKAPALSALGIHPQLVSHLAGKLSITGPTACQAGAIPPLLAGTLPAPSSGPATSAQRARDAILQAQTGSGKTLAFLLPLLQDLLTLHPSLFTPNAPANRSLGTLAIILAPTRELAAQIYSVLESILSLPNPHSSTTFTVNPRVLIPCLLVGGANRTHEKMRLRKGCPIVVATPGRLLDHLRTTESFRMAGEPIPVKGPRGRGAGFGTVPGTGANYGALGRDRNGKGRALGLRWLVVDECDRLMDLGFEEQMKGILEELERRSPSAGLVMEEGRRRTVLCSATASEGVDRLAGMALHDPVTLRASTAGGVVIPSTPLPAPISIPTPAESATIDSTSTPSAESEIPTEESTVEVIAPGEKISFTPPTQLIHNYVVCPPKLRFVALLALLRRIFNSSSAKKGPGTKILVFLSSTDAVNFYWEAIGAMGMGSTKEVVKTNVLESAKDKSERLKREEEEEKVKYASRSALLPGVPVYRLHGNLELAKRLGSLKAFSTRSIVEKGKNAGQETENAVLFCTSVAARGLDVPFVSHVVQYDLPTEGGVTEYIHRVGRTARAGASGQATAFILPTESEWVPWVETGMRDGAEKRGVKDVKLREVGIEDILKEGFGGEGREFETRATDVQMGFERWVSENETNSDLARNAFASHVRAYATHPSSEKSMFNTKSLHLGHLAKSFGMREAPSAGKSKSTSKKTKSLGRVTAGRTLGRPQSAREQADRAIASLPARASNGGDGFETGRRHNEERAMKRQKDQMMKGPSDGGDYQIASEAMLDSLAKAQGAGGGKRKR